MGNFTNDYGKQCDFCEDLVRRHLMSDYENGINPYSRYMNTDDFMEAMEKYDNGESNPCDNSSDYSEFGVPGSYFTGYMKDYSIESMSTLDFHKALTDVTVSLSAPVLLVSKDVDNYGHVFVFMASYFCDNDWEAGGSSIELWM